jgi:hypothetical protein
MEHRAFSVLLLSAVASLAIPCAFSQSCTLTPSIGSVSLGASGTASNGGFLPEIPQSIAIYTGGNCGTLTATVTSSYSTGPVSCGVVNLASGPWLTASVSAGGNILTFIALSNPTSLVRNGAVTIGSPTGASTTVMVSEQPDTETLAQRQVRTLYESILARDPDAGGFNFWTGVGAAGLGGMADDFLTSPESFNTDFAVMAAYQAATGNAPTYAQFEAAVGSIAAGTQTLPGLYTSLLGANTTANDATATTLYANLLNRAPLPFDILTTEAVGLADWFQTLIGYPATATPVGTLNNEFQSTGIYTTDHTNGLYIAMLYFVLLGRNFDVSGYDFWTAIANTGGPGILFQGPAGALTRLQILGPGIPNQGFLGSPEFAGDFCALQQ